MKNLNQLNGKQKRQHLRLLRKVLLKGRIYVRGECSFRIAERLHKAGLVNAYISKWNMMGNGNRSFRELQIAPFGDSNFHGYPVLPRR